MTVILGMSLMLLGILAGIYVATLIHDRRIVDLTAEQYTAMHQMRDKTFARVMPLAGLSLLLLVLSTTVGLLLPGLPQCLGIAAAVLLVTDIVVAVRLQVPINRHVQAWTAATIPSNWARARDHWSAQHALRCGLCLSAYACFGVAVLLSISQRGVRPRSCLVAGESLTTRRPPQPKESA